MFEVNKFSNMRNPPAFFYISPQDLLASLRISFYGTKNPSNLTHFDKELLAYTSLNQISINNSNSYLDYLIVRFGLKEASFYYNLARKYQVSMYFPEYDKSENGINGKAKRIEDNITRIKETITLMDDKSSNEAKPITSIIDEFGGFIRELAISAISTEDVFRQIHRDSDLYVYLKKPLPEEEDKGEIEDDSKDDENKPEDRPEDGEIYLKLTDLVTDEIDMEIRDLYLLSIATSADRLDGFVEDDKLLTILSIGDPLPDITDKKDNDIVLYEVIIESKDLEGETNLKIVASRKNGKTKEKNIKIKIKKEDSMIGGKDYPIISDPDENGIKWITDSEGAEPQPLYPNQYIRWEKLLLQEKVRIPAKILIPKHQQELDKNGVIFDQNGIPQYAPSYKYLNEMNRVEVEQIPYENLSFEDKLKIYGDVFENIVFEDDVYYKPKYKNWEDCTNEEKLAIDFEILYLNHKLELYGNKNKVIIGPDGNNYYPYDYKSWKDLPIDEKYQIDKDILLPEDYDDIYDEKGYPTQKTYLNLSKKVLKLNEEIGNLTENVIVETDADDFEYEVVNPELITVSKKEKELIISANFGIKDSVTEIIIKAQKEGFPEIRDKIIVHIDMIDLIDPEEPIEPEPPEEKPLMVVCNTKSIRVFKDEDFAITYFVSKEDAKINTLFGENGIAELVEHIGDIIRFKALKAGSTDLLLQAVLGDENATTVPIKLEILEKEVEPEPPVPGEDTKIEVFPTKMTLEEGTSAFATVITNDIKWRLTNEGDQELITCEKLGNGVRVFGLKPGTTKIGFEAHVQGSVPVRVETQITVTKKEIIVVPTELNVEPTSKSIKKGEKAIYRVNTNAPIYVVSPIGNLDLTAFGIVIGKNGEELSIQTSNNTPINTYKFKVKAKYNENSPLAEVEIELIVNEAVKPPVEEGTILKPEPRSLIMKIGEMRDVFVQHNAEDYTYQDIDDRITTTKVGNILTIEAKRLGISGVKLTAKSGDFPEVSSYVEVNVMDNNPDNDPILNLPVEKLVLNEGEQSEIEIDTNCEIVAKSIDDTVANVSKSESMMGKK